MESEYSLIIEEEEFAHWECVAFGSGYGSGEQYILAAVKEFFALLKDGRSYNYIELETKLGGPVAWFLINALDRCGAIEWGVSSRYGWLTPCGERLRYFMGSRTVDQLCDIAINSNGGCHCKGSMKESGHERCGKNRFLVDDI